MASTSSFRRSMSKAMQWVLCNSAIVSRRFGSSELLQEVFLAALAPVPQGAGHRPPAGLRSSACAIVEGTNPLFDIALFMGNWLVSASSRRKLSKSSGSEAARPPLANRASERSLKHSSSPVLKTWRIRLDTDQFGVQLNAREKASLAF